MKASWNSSGMAIRISPLWKIVRLTDVPSVGDDIFPPIIDTKTMYSTTGWCGRLSAPREPVGAARALYGQGRPEYGGAKLPRGRSGLAPGSDQEGLGGGNLGRLPGAEE